jgi:hypothetical protein
MSALGSPAHKAYSSGVLDSRCVYYMCAKYLNNTSNPAFIIRIFRFLHTSTNCEVNISPHGSGLWETVLLYEYFLCVHYLWSYSTPINDLLIFCVLCPSLDRFSAQIPGCGTDRGKFLPWPFPLHGRSPGGPATCTLAVDYIRLYSNKFIGRFEKCDDKNLHNKI